MIYVNNGKMTKGWGFQGGIWRTEKVCYIERLETSGKG